MQNTEKDTPLPIHTKQVQHQNLRKGRYLRSIDIEKATAIRGFPGGRVLALGVPKRHFHSLLRRPTPIIPFKPLPFLLP